MPRSTNLTLNTIADHLYGVGGLLSIAYGAVQIVAVANDQQAAAATTLPNDRNYTLAYSFAFGSLFYGLYCSYRAYLQPKP